MFSVMMFGIGLALLFPWNTMLRTIASTRKLIRRQLCQLPDNELYHLKHLQHGLAGPRSDGRISDKELFGQDHCGLGAERRLVIGGECWTDYGYGGMES